MDHAFDKDYWEQHWRPDDGGAGGHDGPPNPYLAVELDGLAPGTALDAGCGTGAEGVWLATAGWEVTAVDISSAALVRAAARAQEHGADVAARVRWVEADLSTWEPDRQLDLVTTHYAHPAMPQLDFYERIAAWVAPGGTLLVVGHQHAPEHQHAPGDGPPEEATATAAAITARLDEARWEVVTAVEAQRSVPRPGGPPVDLHDVVVRAVRRT